MQNITASFPRGDLRILRKLRDLREKISWDLSLDRVVEHLRLLWVFFAPFVVGFFPNIVIREQLLLVLGKIFLRLLGNEIMFVGQSQSFAPGIDKLGACFAVRLVGSCDFRNAFADQCVGDDELRSPIVVFLRRVKRVEKCLHVLPVNFLDVETVGLESCGRVFALGCGRRRVERDRVAIVNQNQIIEPEMRGECARFGGNAFLQTTIAGQANRVLIENAMLGSVKTRGRHFHCDGYANRVANALPQRTGGAFHARGFKKFRMARRLAMQLTEAFDFFHRQIVSAQMQPGIKEHAAVAGGENKVIAPDPARLFRIVFERVTVEDRAHLRAAQRKTEVTGFRSLHRVHAQPACFVCRARKNFEI